MLEERLRLIEDTLRELGQAVSTRKLSATAAKADTAALNIEAIRQEVERNRSREVELAERVAALEATLAGLVASREQILSRLMVVEASK